MESAKSPEQRLVAPIELLASPDLQETESVNDEPLNDSKKVLFPSKVIEDVEATEELKKSESKVKDEIKEAEKNDVDAKDDENAIPVAKKKRAPFSLGLGSKRPRKKSKD
jgi:hypothetical protein